MDDHRIEVVFLRHGHATHNRDAELYGESAYFDIRNKDAELTEKGHAQAKAVGKKIGSAVGFDRIYCSSLRRCMQTLLGAVPDSVNCSNVYIDDRLMEPQGNAVCNRRLCKEEIMDSIPMIWNMDHVGEKNPFDTAIDEGYDLVAEGGPKAEFQLRVAEFIRYLKESATEQNHRRILVVAHHDWILTCCCIVMNEEIHLGNCETVNWYF